MAQITTLKVKDSVNEYVYPNIQGDSNILNLSDLKFSTLKNTTYNLSNYSIGADDHGLFFKNDDSYTYFNYYSSTYFLTNKELISNPQNYIDLYDLIIDIGNFSNNDSTIPEFDCTETITIVNNQIGITTFSQSGLGVQLTELIDFIIQNQKNNAYPILKFTYNFKFDMPGFSSDPLSINVVFNLTSRVMHDNSYYFTYEANTQIGNLLDEPNDSQSDYRTCLLQCVLFFNSNDSADLHNFLTIFGVMETTDITHHA